MPVNTDKILIRIEADISQMKGMLQTVSGDLKSFQRNIDGAKGSVEGFDRIVNKISFQTATQGLLNMSTSAAQVWTSMSNLDRAANQVQASLVALHKAEDQIQRKQIQLNQAIEKYGADSQRAAMISDELATAQEQLGVKTERHKLAVDQLNDTYILMASNLANTVFGSIQTLNTLLSASQKAWLINTLSINGNTIATHLHTRAIKLNAVETKIAAGMTMFDTGAKKLSTIATIQASIATKGLTASIRGLLASIPVLGWAALGVTAAYEVYANNVLGVQDSLNKLFGIQSDENKMLAEQEKALGELNFAMEDSIDKRERMFSSTVKLAGVSSIFKDQIESMTRATTAYQQSVNNITPSSMAQSSINGLNQTPTTGVVIPNIKNINPKQSGTDPYSELRMKLAPYQTSYETRLYGEAFAAEISNILGDKIDLKSIDEFVKLQKEAVQLNYDYGEISKENYDIQMKGLDIAKATLTVEQNKTKESGKQLNYAKEIEQLKKKLSIEYGFTKHRDFESFISGETSYFGKTGIPFSGIVNRKTGELKIALEQQITFEKVDMLIEMTRDAINSGQMTAAGAANFLKQNLKVINSERNIVSSLTGKDTATKAINTMLSGLSKSKMGISQAVAGEMINQYNKDIVFKTKIQGYASAAKARTSFNKAQAKDLGVRKSSSGKALTQAKGGKKKRGHNTQAPMTYEDYFRAFSPNASSSTVGELSRLSGVDIMAGIPDPVSFMKAQQNWSSHIHYRNPNFLKELQAWNARTESYQNTINQRISQANSIISGGRAMVGQGLSELEAKYGFDVVQDQEVVSRIESTLGYRDTSAINVKEQLLATLAGDEKYYNVDDRLRFTDKLAQISTGATVI